MQYADDQVRITAQLIDPDTGAHLWSGNYDRPFKDIFAIQSEIATRIAMALEAELMPSEQQSIEKTPTDSLEAFALYLRAVAANVEGPTVLPGVRTDSLRYLTQAVELDPNFALAHAHIARAYEASMISPVAPDDWISRRNELEMLSQQAAQRALALDPGVGLAWVTIATWHLHSWRIADAHDAFERALQVSPNDHEVVYRVARFNWFRDDRREETLHLARRAVEIDPNNFNSWYVVGMHLYAVGSYVEALAAFRRNVSLGPEPAEYIHLAMAESALGERANALEHLQIAEQLMPIEATPVVHAHLAWAYGQLGQSADARRIFDRVSSFAADRYVDPGAWTWAYLGIRDGERALDALNRAIENPLLLTSYYPFEMILQNALLDPILDQPEWLEVRSRLGFRE